MWTDLRLSFIDSNTYTLSKKLVKFGRSTYAQGVKSTETASAILKTDENAFEVTFKMRM